MLADELHERAVHLVSIRSAPLRIQYAPESVRWGKEWEAWLAEAIRESDFVLVLWTPESRSSHWQLFEIGAAWILGKRLLVVLQDDESTADLPSILSRTQILRWSHFPSEFNQFLDTLKPPRGRRPS